MPTDSPSGGSLYHTATAVRERMNKRLTDHVMFMIVGWNEEGPLH